MKIGIVHGRMQLFHNDHLHYIKLAKAKCDLLYIGITNPDPGVTAENSNDKERSKKANNPFTYYERLEMIRGSLLEEEFSEDEFRIVPFPINYPELIKHYVPLSGTFYLTIYDSWGEHKLEELNALGVKTEVLFRKALKEKIISGTMLRNLIKNKDNSWKEYVPEFVARYLEEQNMVNFRCN